jgi:3-hydroxyisobutyrate dehydrogenase-like beta-hydroxyacid dehydrogenase
VPDGAVWLQTSTDTDVACVAGLAKDHGITFVACPVLGTSKTAKHGRLVCSRPDLATSSTGHS